MELHYYLLIVYLAVAFYTDVRYNRIPNWLTVSGISIGMIYHILTGLIGGLLFSLLGLIVSTLVLLVLYLFKALGAGDVKLFAGVGAIAGLEFSLYGMLYSIIFAGLIGAFLLLFRIKILKKITYYIYQWILQRFSKEPNYNLEAFQQLEIKHFPFMYAVVPGIFITFYYYF